MASSARVLVYIACSLDGFIAGPGDDLSWLPGADGSEGTELPPGSDPGALGFAEFLSEVGALLMGRRTFDVVQGFGGSSPFAERPLLVATHRPLPVAAPHVRAVQGDITELVAHARSAAGARNVYLDGGNLIRQALDARLIDELVVTLVPVVLGQGHALFAGAEKRHSLELLGQYRYGRNLLQLRLRPAPAA
jgi:dihydrofolate reductase